MHTCTYTRERTCTEWTQLACLQHLPYLEGLLCTERKGCGRSGPAKRPLLIASSLSASTGMSMALGLRLAKDNGGSEAERPYSGMTRGRLAGWCTSGSSLADAKLTPAMQLKVQSDKTHDNSRSEAEQQFSGMARWGCFAGWWLLNHL